jgi:methionine-rich copper-binding protein CopC
MVTRHPRPTQRNGDARMNQIVLALTTAIALATSASAHSKSEQTTPANEAVVATVDKIEIRFDDPMRVTAISLTGPDGDVEIARETGLDPVATFRAVPVAAISAGVYTVEWRGLSADGHPMQSSFGFTVAN